MSGIRWLALLALVVGCATGPGDSGALLQGRVIRGPVTPVCIEGVPCELPFAGQFEVERRGRQVTTFRSDDEGRFAIRLAPGEYTVTWSAGGIGFLGQQRSVLVEWPETTVELHFDTGIR